MESQNNEKSNSVLDNTPKPLLYDDLFVEMKVIDQDGDVGKITEIVNICNIYIKYDNGGSGISCMSGCCSDILYEYKCTDISTHPNPGEANARIPVNSTTPIKCTCSCHYQSGITHIAACCDNGYIKSIF